MVGWFVWVVGFVWFRFFFCLVLGFCLALILVGWFFYPLSSFRKNSLLWAKEESKTHVLKLFRTLHGKRHAREWHEKLLDHYSCFCERITSGVIVIFLFLRHQFVENNLILKMGPVDKRKVRAFLNFL